MNPKSSAHVLSLITLFARIPLHMKPTSVMLGIAESPLLADAGEGRRRRERYGLHSLKRLL